MKIVRLIVIPLISLSLYSCATNNKNANYYYSIPTVSYLRDCPGYDCQVVAEIYNANEVRFLDKNDAGWWRVQSLRDQKIGWIQGDLLSNVPLITKNYYIVADELPLRDSPGEDIVSRKLLGYGDEVQKISEKNDWWRVLAEKDKAIGWIPAKMVSEIKPEHLMEPGKTAEISSTASPPKTTSYYFVAAENIKLYIIPSIPSQVVKELKLNDPVEKISQSGSLWVKVRYPTTGAEGWAHARYFKDSPVTNKNQIVTEKKKILKKASSSSQQTKKSVESESLEPEGM
ncbi:MAG: SH3 domain-containing protein [Desulfobaccales bacterium]